MAQSVFHYLDDKYTLTYSSFISLTFKYLKVVRFSPATSVTSHKMLGLGGQSHSSRWMSPLMAHEALSWWKRYYTRTNLVQPLAQSGRGDIRENIWETWW